MKKWNWLIFAGVFAAALTVDQLTKTIMLRELSTTGEFSIWNVVNIHFFPNVGVAFGIPLKGSWLIVFLVIVFLVLLLLYLRYLRSDRVISLIGLAFVLGGAIGNIVDRVRLGFVVDYVAISILPVFNLADVFIIVGVFIMIWRILVIDNNNQRVRDFQKKDNMV